MISIDLCTKECEVMAQIVCPDQPTVSDCVAECVDGQATASCLPETKAYIECVVATGPAALQCDETGSIVPTLESCKTQNDELFACLLGS